MKISEKLPAFLRDIHRQTWSLSIVLSAGYGLAFRAMLVWNIHSALMTIMSYSFLIITPACLGYLCIYSFQQSKVAWWKALLIPWVPLLAGTWITALLAWEGSICIVFFLPLGLVMASVGGVVARAVRGEHINYKVMAGVAVLPFLTHSLEQLQPVNETVHKVHSKIEVSASASRVWQQIKSVPTIGLHEMPDSWVHKIGFPRPLDAEIDREAVGGVRMARFERDLVFVETVTDWQPDRTLAFDIDVDPDQIPPTTLDEHVTIGGPFFDVLHGRYTIEKKPDGRVQLHLTSQFRLSTTFNWYAALWTEAVMQRVQGDILSVVKHRSEAL